MNTYTTGRQTDLAVAEDGAGGFVVVWETPANDGTDRIGASIKGRRFDAAGLPVGDEFQVNTHTTGEQFFANVAPDGAGGFVAVWGSGGSSGTDHDEGSIQGQRFDASGPVGGEFQVNTYTTGFQSFPFVAPLTTGGFVVVWHGDGSSGTDTSGLSIQGQRFDATGTPVGGEFQVNTFTTSYQRYPAVAALDAGTFVVVWSGAGGAADIGESIRGQRFDAEAMPVGDEFQVNTYTTDTQQFPGVVADGSGGFVAMWSSHGSAGNDASNSSIQMRRFDADGTPQGPDFQVNTYTSGSQFGYSLGPDGTGGFVIVWESQGSAGTDTSGDSVQGRRFDAAWQPVGDEFQLNTYTSESQDFPGVALDGSGGFVVVWRSGDDNTEIRAQRFEGVILSTTTTTLAPRGEGVEGRTLKLATKPARPEKSKLALVAKDPALTLGQGNESVDDPVVHGGELTIASSAGGFATTHALTGSWRYVGRAGRHKGYKWKSRTAPIRSVLVKRSRKLAIGGQGAALGFDLDDDPNPVRIELALGAHTYCLEFGGDDRRFKAGRLFRAKRASAPAVCP